MSLYYLRCVKYLLETTICVNFFIQAQKRALLNIYIENLPLDVSFHSLITGDQTIKRISLFALYDHPGLLDLL